MLRGVALRVVDEQDQIRAGFVSEQDDAIRQVREWVGLVARRNWGLRDPEAAVQETLLKLIQMARAGRIREDTTFRAFVVHVARLTCIDAFRKQSYSDRTALSVAQEQQRAQPEAANESVLAADLAQFVLQALKPACRQLLRWVLGEDRPYAWVAEQLDIEVGAARVRAHRCLKAARDIGTQHGRALAPGSLR